MSAQKRYIIFKVYRNSILDDYHDLAINEYEEVIKQLKHAAKKHNREPIITSNFAGHADNFISNTPYLEVLYSDELPKEERDLYISIAQKLFGDAVLSDDRMTEYFPEFVVRFSRMPADDTFEVVKKSNIRNADDNTAEIVSSMTITGIL